MFTKKIFVLSAGQMLNTVISSLFGIYVTRLLGPQDKGVLVVALGSCDLMAMLFSFGIPYSAAYYIRSHPGSESLVLKYANRTMIASGLLSLVLVALGKELFASFFLEGKTIDLFMMLLLVLLVMVNSGNGIIGATLVAQGDSKGFAVSANLSTLVNMAVTFVLILLLDKKLHAVILGTLAGTLVATVIMRRRYRLFVRPGAQVRLTLTAREFFVYGFQAQLGALASLLFKRIDVYIISHWLSIGAVGYYSVGTSLRDVALTVSRALAGLAGGEMADPVKQKDGTARKILRSGILFNVAISVAMLGIAAVLFPFAIPFAYGAAFARSVTPSLIIMGSLLPMAIALLIGKAIHARGKPLLLSIGYVIGALLSSFSVWLLTNRYGINGAALATIVGSVILLVISWLVLWMAEKDQNRPAQSSSSTDSEETQVALCGKNSP